MLSFIRLVDYLVVKTMHSLVVNAVAKLLAVLQEQVDLAPGNAIIQDLTQHSETTADPVDQEMDGKVGCCFSFFTSQTITLSRHRAFLSLVLMCVCACVCVCVCIFNSLLSQKPLMSNLCSSLS